MSGANDKEEIEITSPNSAAKVDINKEDFLDSDVFVQRFSSNQDDQDLRS